MILAALYIIRRKMTLQKPVKGKISSPFGSRTHPVTLEKSSFHNGVDFAVPTGTPVQAPLDGEVLKVYEIAQGGKQMILIHKTPHGKYWRTGYAHLSGWNKKVGDKVNQFDVIAFSGNTGIGTGAHLHFTLTNPDGQKVDPSLYFDKPLV